MDMYPPPVIHKKRGFFSTLVTGVTTIVVTVIVSGAGITLYGMNMLDRKTDSVFDVVRAGASNLPELVESLPPMLADVVNHERMPAYAEQLDVKAYVRAGGESRRGTRPIIEVRNLGDEVVSLLSMRVVVIDEDGDPVAEWNEYVATPVAIEDDDWRGPLLPNTGPRKFASHRLRSDGDLSGYTIECQITDVRVWRPAAGKETSPEVATPA